MKKYFAYALMLGAGAFTLSSCNNAELEERVEKLEQRVVVLEGNGGVAAAKPVLNSNVADVQEVSGPAAAFEFTEEVYDFGTVTEGAVVEHTFRFKNVGEVPLIIQNASASCGCTVPSYSKEPIPVGESGEIQVKFNSDNRVGTQNKTVTITANTKPSINTVKIKGTVVAGQDLSAGPVKQ
ncbi:DUF1573 domain-containing protein [Nafulsella turpanensis]|uniref:DUF1573 domain-containing protein n=1 Tax=Nafulsella turpanensis TaxID=1265690 RepID=UPI000344F2C1|nr:DUF1573 domain-containing protein [Nafulsella turpanensis]